MTVLVLGASGFVGNQVSEALSKSGLNVLRGTRQSSNFPGAFSYPTRLDHIAYVRSMTEALAENGISWIVHAANCFRTGVEVAHSASMLEANLFFPSAILQAALNVSAVGFVNIASGWQITPEKRVIAPNYVATKNAFRNLLFESSDRLHTKTIFVNEIFGPGDKRPKLINLAIRATLDGNELRLEHPQSQLGLVYAGRLGEEIGAIIKHPELRPAEYVFENYSDLTAGEVVALIRDLLNGNRSQVNPQPKAPVNRSTTYPVFGGVPFESFLDDLRQTAAT